MRTSQYILILLAFSVFIFTFGLGNMALTDPDETFYAETAKEMIENGEWITPTIFGKPQFEKPIFYYWLIELSYKAFGVNEFAARFPSALFAIFGVIGIFYLGKLIFSPICGFLSALITATNVQYIVFGRGCVTDMTLSVLILFSLLFFLFGWTGKSKVNYYFSSLMLGLATLTKGPIAIFIVGMIILSYIIFTREFKKLKEVPIALCAIIFFLVVTPWYYMVLKIHGEAFMNEFFGLHNVTRFLVPEHRIGDSPFFYIPVVIGGLFPWSVFLLFGAWDMFKDRAYISEVKAHRLFLGLWFFIVFIFFSASRTKLVTYIFPLFPVLSIVTGRLWEKFLNFTTPRLKRFMRFSFISSLLISIVGSIIVFFVIAYKNYNQVIGPSVLCLSIFIIGLITATVFFFKGKKYHSFLSIFTVVVILIIPLVFTVLPVIEKHESSKDVCLRLKNIMKPGEPLGGESDQRRGLAFYTGITDIVDIHPYQKLIDFINRDERVWGVIQLKHYNQLKASEGSFLPPPVYVQGKRVIITNKPLEAI